MYVGTYADEVNPGGIFSFSIDNGGQNAQSIGHNEIPKEAGYLAFDARTNTLYSVDERKNDGRGDRLPKASVYALSADSSTGALTLINHLLAPTPFPTFLDIDSQGKRLVTSNHGGFDHVEKAVLVDGQWISQYVYDDSAAIVYRLNEDGSLKDLSDLVLLEGHGQDPNGSMQAGGHAQSGPHAHCSVLSPDKKFLLVCDKGTDRVYVYKFGDKLELVDWYQFPEETAPRHLAFHGATRVYLTLELSSEIASMEFDSSTGQLTLLDQESTLLPEYLYPNEPADIRVHPNGRFVYLNNRGEDTLVWFAVSENGKLERKGSETLAKSIHPGLAARSFTFTEDGHYIYLADRPANAVKIYSVDEMNGSVKLINIVEVPQPAYVQLVNF
ncbi:6-phosphogluconolactonase [Vibrio cholerae]|nr:lactonase family protein [Vibrio cholerae]GHW45582.1 6-phosphogluconolactonase [Vibrio cholerae]